MSAPPWFRGDKSRYSPGELLLAALSSNHMTSFLEIASEMGLVVVSYVDDADACARLGARGDGYMAEVTLRPVVTVLPGPHATETSVAWIHERAAEMSVVCKSVALAVTIEPGPLAILEEAVSA
jgi:organic hydroperoxide reductase OsmC/OhrA